MPKNDRERTRKARALMQQRPELNYTRALAEVDAAHAPRERDVDPVLLAPYPDEDGVVVGPVRAAVKRRADRKTGLRPAGGDEARKGTSHKAGEQPRDGVLSR